MTAGAGAAAKLLADGRARREAGDLIAALGLFVRAADAGSEDARREVARELAALGYPSGPDAVERFLLGRAPPPPFRRLAGFYPARAESDAPA